MRHFAALLFLLMMIVPAQGQQFATDEVIVSPLVRLNVRSVPSLEGVVITVIDVGERYPIVARSRDGEWWQISVAGTLGWVYGPLVIAANTERVPVIGTGDEARIQQAVAMFLDSLRYTIGVRANLNIRSGPGTDYNIVGRIPFGDRARVISASGGWWLVDYGGRTGWVSAEFAVPPVTNP